jgi:hypothetical protein
MVDRFLVSVLEENKLSVKQTASNNYDVLFAFGSRVIGLTGSPFFIHRELVFDKTAFNSKNRSELFVELSGTLEQNLSNKIETQKMMEETQQQMFDHYKFSAVQERIEKVDFLFLEEFQEQNADTGEIQVDFHKMFGKIVGDSLAQIQ